MNQQTANEITEMRAAVVAACANPNPSSIDEANQRIANLYVRMADLKEGVDHFDGFMTGWRVYERRDGEISGALYVTVVAGEMLQEVTELGEAINESRLAMERLNGSITVSS